MKKTVLLSLLLITLFAGCKKKHTTDVVPTSTSTNNIALDESFGDNGKLLFYNSSYYDFKFSKDGRIILRNYGYDTSAFCSIFMNGSFDTYFGDWGRIGYGFGVSFFDILSNGNLIVSGTGGVNTINRKGDVSSLNFNYYYCSLLSSGKILGITGDTIKRYNSDYTIDLSFIPTAPTTFFGFNDFVEYEGSIYALNRSQKKLYKLLPNGGIDLSFAGTGFLGYSDSQIKIFNEKIYSCELSVSPISPHGNEDDLKIKRFDLNGNPDASFGNSGFTIISAPAGSSYNSSSIMVSEQNDIYVSFSDYKGPVTAHLMKLKNDGQINSDFGVNGDLNIQDLSYATSGRIKDNYLYILGQSSTYSPSSSMLIKYQIQ